MKYLTNTLLALISASLWLACTKSKSSGPDPVYPLGIYAKINGVAWKAAYVNSVIGSGSGGYSMELDGPDSLNAERLMIEIPSFGGRGTANITLAGPNKAYYSLDTNFVPAPVYATSGQIKVTSLDDSTMGGTFNFVAGSKTITDGTFYVHF